MKIKGKIRAGIVGGAGYTGGELIRLLVNHSFVDLIFVHSKSHAGKSLHEVHQDLIDETDIQFSAETRDDIDVLFLCVGHGDSKKFLQENEISSHVKIISFSEDFRLRANSVLQNRNFVYGLPELNRENIQKAENIANPGCFATAIQLGLLPLAKLNILRDVYTTGITGSTGAGQTLSVTSHFSWRENNVQAYKSLRHQHLKEINESLHSLSGKAASVHFVPWRGDFTRGIFITSQVKCTVDLDEIYSAYHDFYKGHPYIKISPEPIFLKQAVNTNNCFINIEKEGDNLVVHSAIDNLLKGASGQAVQNMNLVFGLDETSGLKLKANYF
jgi:N-acetyl-gamma-glutamyl-phosphate reductase